MGNQLKYLISASPKSTYTVHKVIDETHDPVEEVIRLKALKSVKYILSSGGSKTAREGQETLRRMIIAGGDEITIIAAGSITHENFNEIHGLIRAKIYHGKKIVMNH